MKRDCCFTNGNNWFRYRAAAIIIENGSVLLASNENSDYYYSVGGGVHMGETAEQAVIREVYEETGVMYEVERLAFIHENFFDGDGSTEGLKCHEIALYYLMKPRGTQEIHSDSYCADGKEYMNWIPIKELHRYKAYPEFYREKLYNMGKCIEHIITIENKQENSLTSICDNDLLDNIDKLHTTELGHERISRNIGLGEVDIILWCKLNIQKSDNIVIRGKNWYVYIDDIVITINAHSFTIITAHKK